MYRLRMPLVALEFVLRFVGVVAHGFEKLLADLTGGSGEERSEHPVSPPRFGAREVQAEADESLVSLTFVGNSW